MDFPDLLIALLALPLVMAAAIVGASAVRRRRRASGYGEALVPDATHRLQSKTAEEQSSAPRMEVARRIVVSGRERRANDGSRRR